MEVQLHAFLASAQDGGEWLPTRPGVSSSWEAGWTPEPLWTRW